MRPQQQNRRMRGRGNNNNNNNNGGNNNHNRRGPNPLTRSYESNGPDVKIRGTAQQVAEKYTTLARDAQSAGDRVMAENYLQHAEHYNRIIATALAQQALQQQQQPREFGEDFDGEGEEDNIELPRQIEAQQQQPFQEQPQPQGFGPQPVIEGIPAEVVHAEGSLNGKPGELNGSHEAEAPVAAAEEDAGEAAPRRPRRRRPVRARGERAGGEEAGEAGEATPQPEGEPA